MILCVKSYFVTFSSELGQDTVIGDAFSNNEKGRFCLVLLEEVKDASDILLTSVDSLQTNQFSRKFPLKDFLDVERKYVQMGTILPAYQSFIQKYFLLGNDPEVQ